MSFNSQEEALKAFHSSYGLAMAEWAGLENNLWRWFRVVTNTSRQMSAAIFFSARSFNGRSAMLEAAIPHCSLSAEMKEFALVAMNKAVTYNSYRNMIAHGIPALVIGSEPGAGQFYQLVQGDAADAPATNPVRVQELRQFARNVKQLTAFVSANGAFVEATMIDPQSRLGPPEKALPLPESLERVLMLPNDPKSDEPSQKQAGRQRQRRSQRP